MLSLPNIDKAEFHFHGEPTATFADDRKLKFFDSNVSEIILHSSKSQRRIPWPAVTTPRLEKVKVIGSTESFMIGQGLEPSKKVELKFVRLDQPQLFAFNQIMDADCPFELYIRPDYASALIDQYDYIQEQVNFDDFTIIFDCEVFNYRMYAKIYDETSDLIDHLFHSAKRIVFINLKKVQIDNINQLNDEIERGIYIADDEFMEWLKELNIVDTISIETAKYTKAEFDDKVEKIFTEILYSPLDV